MLMVNSIQNSSFTWGNFKTFEDAAFQSLSRYSTSKGSSLYLLTNPAWKGWIKVGMAVDE